MITIIGLIAAACTTISFLPQALKSIKTRQTKDISLTMYSLFTTGIVLWLVYGIFIRDFPLIAANIVTLIFTLIILVMKIKHG